MRTTLVFPLITAEKLVGYAGAPALDSGAVLNNRERMNAAIKAKMIAKLAKVNACVGAKCSAVPAG